MLGLHTEYVSLCRCPHRILGEAILPFPPTLAEVTLGIGRGHRVLLRSYQEEEAGKGASPGGELELGPEPPGSSSSLCLPNRQHRQSHGD